MSNFPYHISGGPSDSSQGQPPQNVQQPPRFSSTKSSFQSLLNTYGFPQDTQLSEFEDKIPRDPEKFFKDELNKATSPHKKSNSCTSFQVSPQRAMIKIKDFSEILENEDVQFIGQKQTIQTQINQNNQISSLLRTPTPIPIPTLPTPVPPPLIQQNQIRPALMPNPLMMYSLPTRPQMPLPPSLCTWRDPQQKQSYLLQPQLMRYQIIPNLNYNIAPVPVSDPRLMPMPINNSNYNIFMNSPTTALKNEGSQWNNYRDNSTFQTTTPNFQSQLNIPTFNKGAGLSEVLANDEDTIPTNNIGTSRLREFFGYVTSIDENFGTGMIEHNIFFQLSCVKGDHPKLHQKVFVLAEDVDNMPFRYNAKLVRVLLEGSSFSQQNSSTSLQSSSLANNSIVQAPDKVEQDNFKSLFKRTGKKAPPAPKLSADIRLKRSRSRSPIIIRRSSPQSQSRSRRRSSRSRSHSPDYNKRRRSPPPPLINPNRSRSRSPTSISLSRRTRNWNRSKSPNYSSSPYSNSRQSNLKVSPPPLNDRIISPLMNKRILKVSPPPLNDRIISPLMNKRILNVSPPPLNDRIISPLMNKRVSPPQVYKRNEMYLNSDKNKSRNIDKESPVSIKSKEINDSKKIADTKSSTTPSRKNDSKSKAEGVKQVVGILKSSSKTTTLPNLYHEKTSNKNERIIEKSKKAKNEEIDMFDVDDSHFQVHNPKYAQKNNNVLADVTSNEKNTKGKVSDEKIKMTTETFKKKKDVNEIESREQDRVKMSGDKVEELEEIWETDSVEEMRKMQEKEKAISEMTCEKCGQVGHIQKFCFVNIGPVTTTTTNTVKDLNKKSDDDGVEITSDYDEITGLPVDLEEETDENIKVKQWLDKSEEEIIVSPSTSTHGINQDQVQVIENDIDIDDVEIDSVKEVGKLINERIAEREKIRERQMKYRRGGRGRSRSRGRGRYHPSGQSSNSNNIAVVDNVDNDEKSIKREAPKRYIRGVDFDLNRENIAGTGSRSSSQDLRRHLEVSRFSPQRHSPIRYINRVRRRSRTPPHFRRAIRSRTRTPPELRRSRSPRSPMFYQRQHSPPPLPEHHHVSVQNHGFTLTRTVFQDVVSNMNENRRSPSPTDEPEIVYFEHPPLHSHTYTHIYPPINDHSHIYTHPHPNPNLDVVQLNEDEERRSISISRGRKQRRSSSRGRRGRQRSPIPLPNHQHFPLREFSRSPSPLPNPHFRRQFSRSPSSHHDFRHNRRQQSPRSMRGRQGELDERERIIQQREYELSLELERFGYEHGRSPPRSERVKIRMIDDLVDCDPRPRRIRRPSSPLPLPPHKRAICKCCGKLGHFWEFCFNLKPGVVFSDSEY